MSLEVLKEVEFAAAPWNARYPVDHDHFGRIGSEVLRDGFEQVTLGPIHFTNVAVSPSVGQTLSINSLQHPEVKGAQRLVGMSIIQRWINWPNARR